MAASQRQPVCDVIGGPNGAGKTTFAMNYLPKSAHCLEFVNTDMIARGLSPFLAEDALIAAGRILLERLEMLAEARKDFAFETTLSGRSYARFLKRLRSTGYRVELYYLWIPSARFSAQRVAHRVANGGHGVPAGAVSRRFGKSLRNLTTLYLPLADYAVIWDNSALVPRCVYEKQGERITVFQEETWRRIREYANEQDT
jgi:predicted ABC-type ATPase